MQTGLQHLKAGQKTVYYADNGEMQYGWKQLGHYYYYFHPETGAMSTGTQSIADHQYQFKANGVLQNFTERVIDWFLDRTHLLTYSIYGSRDGSDGIGSTGHIMIISSGSGADAKEISICSYAMDAYGHYNRNEAVKELNYRWYWNWINRPSVHVYRPNVILTA